MSNAGNTKGSGSSQKNDTDWSGGRAWPRADGRKVREQQSLFLDKRTEESQQGKKPLVSSYSNEVKCMNFLFFPSSERKEILMEIKMNMERRELLWILGQRKVSQIIKCVWKNLYRAE